VEYFSGPKNIPLLSHQARQTQDKKKKSNSSHPSRKKNTKNKKSTPRKVANIKNGSYDMENDNFRAIINERQSAIKVKAMLLKDVLIFS
jgi:hypothetical protein